MIYQTAYFSAMAPGLPDREVLDILETSRRNNARLRVTGMLLLVDQVFFQILEGDRSIVENLMKRIESDARHSGLLRVLREHRRERNFAGWTMGFERLAYGKLPARLVSDTFDTGDLSADRTLLALAAQTPELVIFMRALYRSRQMAGAPTLPTLA